MSQGRLESIAVMQQDPMKRGLVWPQRLRVTLGYDGSLKELPGVCDRKRHHRQGRERIAGAAISCCPPAVVWATAFSCSTTAAATICYSTSRTCPTR